MRFPEKRLLSAPPRLRRTVQRELCPAQEDFPQGRTGINLESLLNDYLGLTKLLHLAENQSHKEIRRRIAASGEIDGFLEGLFGLGRVAKSKARKAFIVIGPSPVVAWIFRDRAIKIGDASSSVSFQEQLDAFVKRLLRFAGRPQLLHRDDTIVHR